MKIIAVPFLYNLPKYAKKEHVDDVVGNAATGRCEASIEGRDNDKTLEIQALRTGKGEDNPWVIF